MAREAVAEDNEWKSLEYYKRRQNGGEESVADKMALSEPVNSVRTKIAEASLLLFASSTQLLSASLKLSV